VSPRSQEIKQSGLFGFLAQPDTPTKAGVVLLPTIFGVNAFAKSYAETLARAGIATVVWDHYDGAPLTTDYEECKKRASVLTDAKMQTAVKAWTDYLLSEIKLNSIGVIGFCMGGRYVPIVAARDKRIKACAAVYPSIEVPNKPNQAEDALALAREVTCPVLVVQPGHDHVATPETYAALKDALNKRSAPTIWHYYPDAEHGFMHRPQPAANPAATVMASPQIVGFLQGCLT
jgi:carboxymethylenebutenolidase